jgi:hypothetical protein
MGVTPSATSAPPNAANPDGVIQHYHTAQGRSFWDSFYISYLYKRNYPERPMVISHVCLSYDTSAFHMKIVVFLPDVGMVFFIIIQVR